MRPGHKELKMENLHQLDGGKLAACFDHHLQNILRDCEDRPHEDGKRKLVLESEVSPVADDVSISHVTTVYNVKASVPKAKTRPIVLPAKVTKDSQGRARIETSFEPSDDGEDPDFLDEQEKQQRKQQRG
jgi:hypothetical protein